MHPGGLESNRAPADVGRGKADRHDQIVDVRCEQAAPWDLPGTGEFGQKDFPFAPAAGDHLHADRVRVHAPVGDGDAVAMNRRALESGREGGILFSEDVTAHQATRFAHVHFPRHVAVVGELIAGESEFACACAQ